MSGNCGITFYVEAPDVEAALVQAEKLGGTRLTAPPRCSPESKLGQFSDPGGHMVGLLEGPA
jgi:hypothetical protein